LMRYSACRNCFSDSPAINLMETISDAIGINSF
jgi:hypothetical protein